MLAAGAIIGMVARPWRLPEWCWPVAGAVLLLLLGLLPPDQAAAAALAGWDVYLFIGGMMLLADLARREGLFDWLASHAVTAARGSPVRLFTIVYVVGVVVTVFMSNDATAVVLTPAVAAAVRKAKARPLPHLFACAFVANAASFALPISNPANLVIYDGDLPGLAHWARVFGPASLAAVLATFVALRFAFRRELDGQAEASAPPPLTTEGRIAAVAVIASAIALLAASALRLPLGPPACAVALAGVAAVTIAQRRWQGALLREVSWTSLLLVAGLFVIVRALETTGALAALSRLAAEGQGRGFAALAACLAALACNLMNNLPAGMLAATALSAAHASEGVRNAVAVGIDLGPNLTVIGSLSSVLWLLAVRREGLAVDGWRFLRVGLLATPLAMGAALALL